MKPLSDQLFPETDRVIYDKAPLVEVVCQLRFPKLLSIESSPPVDFQEKIRDRFPLLEQVSHQLPLPDNLPPQIARLVEAQATSSSYRFLTEDRRYTVTLAAEWLAVSTNRYERWEDFRENLYGPLDALVAIYRPSFFSRVGLRYQNAIDRDAIGLKGIPWSELFNKEILGELALERFEANLEGVATRGLRIKLPGEIGSISMRHGLGTFQERPALCYMIDLDLFAETKVETKDAKRLIERFNSIVGGAFRWCISERLHRELGPRKLAKKVS